MSLLWLAGCHDQSKEDARIVLAVRRLRLGVASGATGFQSRRMETAMTLRFPSDLQGDV
jgi:hypothetical protein